MLTSARNRGSVAVMSNVLGDNKQQQVLALGRLGWSLRRIQAATAVHRDTASVYLKAAGIPVRERGGRPRVWPPPRPATTSEVSTDANSAKPATTELVSTDQACSSPPDTALIEVNGAVVARGIARVPPGLFDLLGGVRPIRAGACSMPPRSAPA